MLYDCFCGQRAVISLNLEGIFQLHVQSVRDSLCGLHADTLPLHRRRNDAFRQAGAFGDADTGDFPGFELRGKVCLGCGPGFPLPGSILRKSGV